MGGLNSTQHNEPPHQTNETLLVERLTQVSKRCSGKVVMRMKLTQASKSGSGKVVMRGLTSTQHNEPPHQTMRHC